jgi:hypothetical protein
MTSSSEFVARSDNATDYATQAIDKLEQDALEEIDDLVSSLRRRDVELWQKLDTDATIAIGDYDQAENNDRDIYWILGLASLFSAATHQYFLHHRKETILKPLAYRMQKMDGLTLTAAAAIVAGTRATQIEAITAFDAVDAKYLGRLVKLDGLSNSDLYDALARRGAIKPLSEAIAEQAAYVSRMTPYAPSSPQFQGAVADLVSTNSARALQGMNRRAVERLSLQYEVGGEMSQQLVWIIENDPKTCEWCEARAGEIHTYEDWLALGLPGAAVCAGGDLCRCHLAAI